MFSLNNTELQSFWSLYVLLGLASVAGTSGHEHRSHSVAGFALIVHCVILDRKQF